MDFFKYVHSAMYRKIAILVEKYMQTANGIGTFLCKFFKALPPAAGQLKNRSHTYDLSLIYIIYLHSSQRPQCAPRLNQELQFYTIHYIVLKTQVSVRLVLNLACTCTIEGLNGTLVESKMFTIQPIECTHFIFNKCPIQTHDGANAKFSTS